MKNIQNTPQGQHFYTYIILTYDKIKLKYGSNV